ncbi:MAG: UDP-N-acetylmuramoylalanyl-D-glutamyl-2,6-diaminopimelate--D-alanyl-D-alanine ligase [Alphaproteobacteria bacterium]|nr:UDP-N-acetylmuramoylalanyl-D-glutamyl-2,6-diaminopimelate--D-alanyl-D-alanine ligase [Alphaproteobacteria bacterium]
MNPEILWTAAQAAVATGGKSVGNWQASGVSIDSRSVGAGDLFVALTGDTHDGHDFVADALKRGAAAAVVARVPMGLPAGAPLLLVKHTLEALNGLGRIARARATAKVVAVTGSVGKTGTKEMLRLALTGNGRTYASAGNLNNQFGLPLSLARLPREAQFAVFEIGMNHAGEIEPLSKLARPNVALITNVEPVHLEFFDSVEAIADAKAEIFAGMDRAGVAVLNRDNRHFDRLAEAALRRGVGNVIDFGRHADARYRLIDCSVGSGETRVTAALASRRHGYTIGAEGRHWAINSLGVLAAADALGADLGAAAAALAGMSAPKGRGQRLNVTLPGGALELIDDSYNASPPAMGAAFAVLAGRPIGVGGRRIAVLGDMLELGKAAPQLHQELATEIDALGIDLVFACGPNMAFLVDALPARRRGGHAADSTALIPIVTPALRAGDVVLVKGSLGSRMGPVMQAIAALGSAKPGEPPRRVVNGG